MAKKQKKFYVVWKGHKPGVFETWAECQKQVSGFSGAEYKSFLTKTAAWEAYKSQSKNFIGKPVARSGSSRRKIGQPIMESISVDAACDGAPGNLEYQGVDTKTGKLLFAEGPFPEGTNNVGEFLALVRAAYELKKQGSEKPIYSDSRTALAWVRNKKANTKLAKTGRNDELFRRIANAEKWLAENEISNPILKWETEAWGEIKADYGRK